MSKRQRVTAADERAFYNAMFGENRCLEQGSNADMDRRELLEHYDESLWIYQDMLRNAIRINDHNDVCHLKRNIQEIKEAKRRLLAG